MLVLDVPGKRRKGRAGAEGGKHQARMDREGIIARKRAGMHCMEATSLKHRVHIKEAYDATCVLCLYIIIHC